MARTRVQCDLRVGLCEGRKGEGGEEEENHGEPGNGGHGSMLQCAAKKVRGRNGASWNRVWKSASSARRKKRRSPRRARWATAIESSPIRWRSRRCARS